MKRPYQITGMVLVVFSALVTRESLELGLDTPLGPGPGFFPFWTAIVTGMLGGIMLYRATVGQSDPMPQDLLPSSAGYLRVGAIVLAMVGVLILMTALGFRLTIFAFLLFLLFALGRQNPIIAVLVALFGSLGVYHAFVQWLRIPLPTGMFGF